LAPGAVADLTAFELLEGAWSLPDADGTTEVVERLIVPRIAVRAGELRQLTSTVEHALVV
ncbi:MAG: amidohydrolase/deacetylase family metallohydrolase, partial [Acidimicrobiales bacterium]